MQFIRSFPRLQQLVGYFEQLDSFNRIFTLMEELPDLKSFAVCSREGGETASFFEDYLATKSLEEQDMFVTRLTQVTGLGLSNRDNFCTNTIKFIMEYLPGLESFAITSSNNMNWTDLHKEIFFRDILELICNLKKTRFDFSKLKAADMINYLPVIAQHILCQPPQDKSSKKWGLNLHIPYRHGDFEEADLEVSIDRTKSLKSITASATDFLDISNVVSRLFGTIPALTNVDKLTANISPGPYASDEITDAYEKILYKIPSLKEISFKVPMLEDDRKLRLSTLMCPMVQKLTLEIWYDYSFVIDVESDQRRRLYKFSLKSAFIEHINDMADASDVKYSLQLRIVGTSLQQVEVVTLSSKIIIDTQDERAPYIMPYTEEIDYE